jgi:nicotinate-nucleotide pyrophosphorylase (carboxylating)
MHPAFDTLVHQVSAALDEDLGPEARDLTAELIPESHQAEARLICREPALVAGVAWANETFRQVDPSLEVTWQVQDGDWAEANQLWCEIRGNARSILTAERTAMNFLQTLTGTATTTLAYRAALGPRDTLLLDTRKTIPGLRLAQKYACTVGGATNHRLGLYDAFLIKENHIAAHGSITGAVTAALDMELGVPVEVEVESMAELDEALQAGATWIMLDNFSLDQTREAVELNQGRARLEASGNVQLNELETLADTGVDAISVGALTKHVRACDLSLRVEMSA